MNKKNNNPFKDENIFLQSLRRDMAKLWAEGWAFASPYLAKSYGALGAASLIGFGIGIIIFT